MIQLTSKASPLSLGPMALQWQLRDQTIEVDPVDQCRDTDRVVALSGQQAEVDKIAKGIRQRHDLGRDTPPGGAYGLALSPPRIRSGAGSFAPPDRVRGRLCPWRWTLTMVPSIIAYSISGSSDTEPNISLKTSR